VPSIAPLTAAARGLTAGIRDAACDRAIAEVDSFISVATLVGISIENRITHLAIVAQSFYRIRLAAPVRASRRHEPETLKHI
jgi:hypothetical protein